jgi:N-methylhydantoinase A
MEIGGTSCDVTLMGKGQVAVSDDLMIADYQLATPSVEIYTVGAGGGTIAGVDAAGLVFVGPEGAGARPGPACYGFGGERPTVTDAQLVLGRLRPGPYAGGAVSLDAGLAHRAIEEHVAKPLGVDVERAAIGIIQVLEQNLLHAVERMSIERGHNTRHFTLLAAGGAGPMHGSPVARMLGCRRVYVPRQAGAFCALGMLYSDIRQDFMRVHLAELLDCDMAALRNAYDGLIAEARRTLDEEGLSGAAARIEREMDLRYRGQQWSVRVPVSGEGDVDVGAVKSAFEAEHDRLYGHVQPMSVIEITQLRVVARGVLSPPTPAHPDPAATPANPFETRPVYLDARTGWAQTRVYRGTDLTAGHEIAGPTLIEEQTTTVLVGAGDTLRVDASGNFEIELGGGDA